MNLILNVFVFSLQEEEQLIITTIALVNEWTGRVAADVDRLDIKLVEPIVTAYESLVTVTEHDTIDINPSLDRTSTLQLFPCFEGIDDSEYASGLPVRFNADNESKIWSHMESFVSELSNLVVEANSMGISSLQQYDANDNSTISVEFLQLELCCAAIHWISLARKVLLYPHTNLWTSVSIYLYILLKRISQSNNLNIAIIRLLI